MKINDIITWNFPQHTVNWDFIESIPEIAALKTVKQSPEWHAEGSAWEHTKYVVKNAVYYSEKLGLNIPETGILVTAALLHDVGKTATTFTDEVGKIHSYGHEFESEKIARRLLWDESVELRERICNLVKLHMEMHGFKRFKQFPTFKKRLHAIINRVDDFYLLCLLHMCDTRGSYYDSEQKCRDLDNCEAICEFAYRHKHDLRDVELRKLFHMYHKPLNVYVMIGLPGAGKSTFIENMDFQLPCRILSRDRIRVELGFCGEGDKIVGTKEQEDAVSKAFDTRFLEYLGKGYNVVIDNINLVKKYRDHYKSISSKYNIKWTYIYVQAPTLEDNYTRRPMISKDVYNSMLRKFEFPEKNEYDELLIIKNNA